MESESDDPDFISKAKPSKVTPSTKDNLSPTDDKLSIFVRTTSYTKSKSQSSRKNGPSKNGKRITANR